MAEPSLRDVRPRPVRPQLVDPRRWGAVDLADSHLMTIAREEQCGPEPGDARTDDDDSPHAAIVSTMNSYRFNQVHGRGRGLVMGRPAWQEHPKEGSGSGWMRRLCGGLVSS